MSKNWRSFVLMLASFECLLVGMLMVEKPNDPETYTIDTIFIWSMAFLSALFMSISLVIFKK